MINDQLPGPAPTQLQKRMQSAEVLNRACRTHKVEKSFVFNDTVEFYVSTDHILPSTCLHASGDAPKEDCLVCLYKKELTLPNIPDMIYASNVLRVSFKGREIISFNALDALKMVDPEHLPGIRVGASEVWQRARKDLPPIPKNYDWTFTSDYAGTVAEGVRVEETEEPIDLELLKRPDPLHFVETVPLYEDEMDDNGCSEMTVRVRVMPTNFLVLCRFYLRVDGVLLRVQDCRLYAEAGWPCLLSEWTRRESSGARWTPRQRQHALDPAQLWQHLPVRQVKRRKLFYAP